MAFTMHERVRVIDIAGWVGDFCPICRRMSAFVLRTASEVESELHLVGIVPVVHEAERGILGHDRVCDACGFCAPASPLDYAELLKEKPAGLEELLRRTHPDAPRRYARRLELESARSDGTLTVEQRRAFLAETLHALEPHLRRVLPRPLSRGLWLLPLSLIVGGAGLGALSSLAPALVVFAGLSIFGGVVGLLLFAVRAWLRPAFVRRTLVLEAYPLLVRAWTPLSPRREDMEAVIDDLRGSGSALARAISMDRFLLEMPGA